MVCGYSNKTITPEELIELEEASRYYYVLKKFNWLLASTNKNILDVNVERRFNHRLNRYLNYSEILAYMLAIDDELEEAFYQRNDVTYFYGHCTYDQYLLNQVAFLRWFCNVKELFEYPQITG